MNNTVLTIIAAGLFIAWLFSPIVILRYIRVDVQRRWKEIEDWFCAIQETDMLPKLYQKKSGAWFYARFLKPDANPTDPKQILKTQFLQFHDPWHYALPLLLVFVLSGLMLAFTGLWLADALSSKGTSPTGTNVQLKTSVSTKAANATRSAKGDKAANHAEATTNKAGDKAANNTGATTNKTGDKTANNTEAATNKTGDKTANNTEAATSKTGDKTANNTEATTNKTGDKVANNSEATTNNKVPTTLLGRIKIPFIMALWGAFVWSVYEILSRRKSGDLTPLELYDVAFRFVAAVPIGYAFSLLVFDNVAGFVAFAVSAFPLRDIRLLMRSKTLQKMEHTVATTSPSSKGYVGELVSSLGGDKVARLEELNIETYLDLAYADPISLMIRTGVPIKLVLSWIDLALPAVYFPEQKVILEKLGMVCAVDLCEFYTRECFDVEHLKQKEGWKDQPAVKQLAHQLKIPVDLLYQPLASLYEDTNAKFVIGVSHQSAT